MLKSQRKEYLKEFLGYDFNQQTMALAEQQLAERWYDSHQQDFSVYNTDQCLLWLFNYQYRSFNYIKSSLPYICNGLSPTIILDYCCGLGFSSLMLAEKFPDAHIIGTNYPGHQAEFCDYLITKIPHNNVTFLAQDEVKNINADVCYAIEVFEHCKEPCIELSKMSHLPTIVESTSFTVKSIGHYDEYIFNGQKRKGFAAREASLSFTKEFIKLGFIKEKTNFWTGRPRIWRKVLYV